VFVLWLLGPNRSAAPGSRRRGVGGKQRWYLLFFFLLEGMAVSCLLPMLLISPPRGYEPVVYCQKFCLPARPFATVHHPGRAGKKARRCRQTGTFPPARSPPPTIGTDG